MKKKKFSIKHFKAGMFTRAQLNKIKGGVDAKRDHDYVGNYGG